MEKDLLMVAKKHELQGYRKNKTMLSQISVLDATLSDVYAIHRPNSRDYDNRRDLIRISNEIAREIYGDGDKCPVVEEFGSFVMDMFNPESDLDLSINFRDKKVEVQRADKIKTLRKFAKSFYALQRRGLVTKVQPIVSARVPVLKVTDCGTGIECDFSVGNLDGIVKSQFLLMISAIDERFQKLCFLMKLWAQGHDINSSKDGTLNSLSLILLVALHLQSRDIPILPPFSSIFKDEIDLVAVKKNLPNFLNYGKTNNESLAELFVSLLLKLRSVETLWRNGLCASAYEGSWKYKECNPEGSKNGCLNVEDFTDRSQNTARVVKAMAIAKIYSCINLSIQQIQSFVDGQIDAVELKNLLFVSKPVTNSKLPLSVSVSLSQPVKSASKKKTKKRKHEIEKEKKKKMKLEVEARQAMILKKCHKEKQDESSRYSRTNEANLNPNPIMMGSNYAPPLCFPVYASLNTLISVSRPSSVTPLVPRPSSVTPVFRPTSVAHSVSRPSSVSHPVSRPSSVTHPVSRLSGVTPHHHSYPPHNPYKAPPPPVGPHTSYAPRPSFPFVPSPFPQGSYAPQPQDINYRPPPMPYGNVENVRHFAPYHQNPGGEPPFFYRRY